MTCFMLSYKEEPAHSPLAKELSDPGQKQGPSFCRREGDTAKRMAISTALGGL